MYGIHRIEKRSRGDVYGIQLEANRTVSQHLKGREFPGSDIDWLKTKENVFLVKNDNWWLTISNLLKEKNIKPRKNSVVLLDSIYTASAEFFQGKNKEQIIDYFKACLEFHEKTYGNYVINAVIHFDEVKNGNIHLHIASCPVVERENGTFSLSARDLCGGREEYRKRQDDFYSQVSSLWGLERGEVKDYAEVRKHIDKMEYEAQEAKIKAEKAKAELNIRSRVLEACENHIEHIEILGTTKESKLLNRPATVSVRASDLQELEKQVSTAHALKKGLAELDKLAKEVMSEAATDERIIKAERERQQIKARCVQLEKQVAEQTERANGYENYVRQLENWMYDIKVWLKNRSLYKTFIREVCGQEVVEAEPVKERVRERIMEREWELER